MAGFPLLAAGAVAAPIIGAGIDAWSQSSANAMNLRQAREQMAFQERLSSTAHQREVKDLKAAGLNPMLSAMRGSGASSPSGAQAVAQPVARGTGAALSSSAHSALDVARKREEVRLVKEQADTAAEGSLRAAIENMMWTGTTATRGRIMGVDQAYRLNELRQSISNMEATGADVKANRIFTELKTSLMELTRQGEVNKAEIQRVLSRFLPELTQSADGVKMLLDVMDAISGAGGSLVGAGANLGSGAGRFIRSIPNAFRSLKREIIQE